MSRLVLAVVLATSSAHAEGVWSPIDDGGWPKGHTMETLRALHPCGAGELEAQQSGAIPCRPAAIIGAAHLAFGFDWMTGVALDDRTSGGAQGLGVEVDYAATRNLQLGARYEMLGVGDGAIASRAGHNALALAKWRLFTDEVDRDAITLGLGGGIAARDRMLGGAVPVVRASLAREVGLYLDDNNSVNAALELAYERTIDADAAQAVIAAIRLGWELDIREPDNMGTVDDDPDRVIGFDVHAASNPGLDGAGSGIGLGLGVSLGVPLSSIVSWQTSGSFLFGSAEDGKLHGYENASWAAQTGFRATSGAWHDALAAYVQVQGGAAWYSQTAGAELRWIATPEIGTTLYIGCGGLADIGAWLRSDLENGGDVLAGGALVRFGFGTSRAGGGMRCGRGNATPLYASEPLPPPPPVVATETTTTTVTVPHVTVPSVEVQVDAGAAVEVEPVVIEVTLGVEVFGARISIDPRVVPVARLRGAGFVEVELSGPSGSLQHARAELAGTVDRAGARIDAWAVVSSDSSAVRAKFTIWPPGTRPPGR